MKKHLTNERQEQVRAAANDGHKVDFDIKAAKVRVIGAEGQNLGLMALDSAVELAHDQNLQLVQLGNPDAEGIVAAKIMDIGKFLYEKKKQRNEAKKKQKVIELKELKFRPNIGDGDYKLRVERIAEFLREEKHVKITLQFRGRENVTKDTLGQQLFERIEKDVKALFGDAFDVQKESKGDRQWSKNLVPKAA